MAILTIDGWEIPVESVTRGVEYLDTYKRAFSGNLRDGTRFAKRKWDVTTAYLNQDDARTLRALIHNEGDRLSANHILGSTKWDNDSKNFLVSNKGNVIGASNVATYRPFEGPNNTHAFALEQNTTNAFKNDVTVNPSLEGTLEGAGPYTLSGFTIDASNLNVTQDTLNSYHQSKDLQISYKTSGETSWRIYWTSINITTLGLSVGDTVTFSWYERHNMDLSSVTGDNVIPQIKFYDFGKNELAGTAVTLNSLGHLNLNWHRHSITATIPDDTVYIFLQVGWDNPNFGTNQYYCIDALQLEKMPFATSFTMDTRNNYYRTMPFIINHNPNEMSVFIKTKTDFTSTGYFTVAVLGSSYGPAIFAITYNNIIEFVPEDEQLRQLANPNSPTQWDNLCGIYNVTEGKMRLYSNGSKIGESNITKRLKPDFSTILLNIPSSGYLYSTLLTEIYILPIAVSDSFAKAYTSSWLVPNNNLLVSGDCANGQVVPCYAELGDTETASYWQGGTVYLAEKVRFTLYEI